MKLYCPEIKIIQRVINGKFYCGNEQYLPYGKRHPKKLCTVVANDMLLGKYSDPFRVIHNYVVKQTYTF